jgi:dTDP-4-amino-4,6-dideoxygalactose transaminase
VQKRRKVLSPYQEKLRECFESLLTEIENLDNVRSWLLLFSRCREAATMDAS